VLVTAVAKANAAELALSKSLQLPLINSEQFEHSKPELFLKLQSNGLTLFSNEVSAKTRKPVAVLVDFADVGLNYRATDAIGRQNIGKAVGVKAIAAKTDHRPTVLDAMAGLGRDAYLLASLGCEVLMLERSPVIHALLSDGLSRAMNHSSSAANPIDRLQLMAGDFIELASSLNQFDVVYLDPMFPPKKKTAQVKKEMYILQLLLQHGIANDEAEVLNQALRLARKRVVIKRAKLSPHYGARKPDVDFRGSSSRYDVYLA